MIYSTVREAPIILKMISNFLKIICIFTLGIAFHLGYFNFGPSKISTTNVCHIFYLEIYVIDALFVLLS